VKNSQTTLFTFHKIREQCEQGNEGAWRAFLDFYSPVFFRLLEIHGNIDGAEAPRILKKALEALAANGFERFRATSRQSEREFLGDIRCLLLEVALEKAFHPAQAESAPGGIFETEKITKLLEELPLLHKEMLFFKLSGYHDDTLERVLRIAPRVAEKAFERLTAEYAPARNAERERCPWPAGWLAFLKRVREMKTDKCQSTHQFVRVHDGQVSWYDKEPVEKHVSACLHCLDSWTGIREVGYWRHAADPVSASKINELLEVLPIERAATKKSFFARLRS
jgi:hypothetical protein